VAARCLAREGDVEWGARLACCADPGTAFPLRPCTWLPPVMHLCLWWRSKELARWACHLRLQLADLQASVGAQDDTQESLDAGLLAATDAKLPCYQLLFMLAGLQLAMLSGNTSHVQHSMAAAARLMDSGGAAPGQEGWAAGMPPAFAPYARLHFRILSVGSDGFADV
jgi:hypothetical protein